MAFSIVRQPTANDYGATGLFNLPPCDKLNVSVESNPVLMQTTTERGNTLWGAEVLLRPGVHNRTEHGIRAVRFKSATTGLSATVSAEASP